MDDIQAIVTAFKVSVEVYNNIVSKWCKYLNHMYIPKRSYLLMRGTNKRKKYNNKKIDKHVLFIKYHRIRSLKNKMKHTNHAL